jgi:hypothetical protein
MDILTILPAGSSSHRKQEQQQQCVRKVNIIGIYNFRQDLMALETFAESSGVPQLAECFSSLAQLLELLLSEDLTQILDAKVRETSYPLVNLSKLVAVLHKYKELGGLSASRRRATQAGLPTIKKRAIDALLSNLSKLETCRVMCGCFLAITTFGPSIVPCGAIRCRNHHEPQLTLIWAYLPSSHTSELICISD